MAAEFAVPTVLMFLMLVGVILKKTTFMKRTYLPAPIIGGLIGFILMNTGVLNLPYMTFERITFHLFTLSFISITYMNINDPKAANKGVFRGGLWLAIMFGMMITIQLFIGATIFLGYNAITGSTLLPALGALIAHGFGQGPGQAVAMGTIWQSLGAADAAQYGLFYAASGYLFAILVGVPYAKRLIKKGKVSYDATSEEEETNFNNGIIENGTKDIIGHQTAHHSNLDTISLHFALIGGTYFIAYLFVLFINTYLLTDPMSTALLYGNMFVWGILFAMLFKAIIKKLKFGYMINGKFQKSITGFLVDYLMLSALLSISLAVIADGIVAVILTVIIVGTSTFFIVRYFSSKFGDNNYERFMCEFGIVTGTAATGMLLLRTVDPQFKTPVIQELAWWNILQMTVGWAIFMSQFGMPITQFWVWYAIIFVMILLFLLALRLFKLWKIKGHSY
jgi:ESS family glutamate:Na+ symporter